MSPTLLVPGEHYRVFGDGPERVTIGDFSTQCFALFGHEIYRRGTPGGGSVVGRLRDSKFEPLTDAGMRELIDKSAHLEAWRKPKGENSVPRGTFVTCTLDLAGAVLQAARGHKYVAQLDSVVPHPLATRTGGVLTRFEPDVSWDVMRMAAGGNDERDLVELSRNRGASWFPRHSVIVNCPSLDVEPLPVWDLVYDFPLDEASKANLLALLLTPLFRPLLGGNVPLFVVTAPVERSGKSKLVADIVGGILLGGPVPTMQWPEDEDEIDKRVLSMLLAGYSIACVDNVPGKLDSAALASLITSEIVAGRILGQSTMAALKNTMTIVATGNHVECSGEIARRAVVIELQPNDENPELRMGWRHPDLKDAVAKARPRVLRWLVDLVEAWAKDGCKPMSRPFGGFERWAQTVGGVVEHAGFPVLVDQKARIAEMDEDGADLRRLVEGWFERHSHETVAAGDLFELAKALEVWPGTMARARDPRVAFGRKMGFYVGRRIGDLKLERLGTGSRRFFRLAGCADGFVSLGTANP